MFKTNFKPYLTIINLLCMLLMFSLNTLYQGFCVPSTWAQLVLLICGINFLFSPYLIQSRFGPIAAFINGIACCVLIYMIVFLELNHLFGFILIFVGVGVVFFLPHFFIYQLIRMYFIEPFSVLQRKIFLSAILLCLMLMGYAGVLYNKALADVNDFKTGGYNELNQTFMNEKILGMHFIYHTRICIYDGWRPPIHEPLLIMGLWLNGRKDPLAVDLKTRLNLYKRFFPDNPYKYECSCAIEESKTYHQDQLWR